MGAALPLALLAGCATVTTGQWQDVQVVAWADGLPVLGARCTLQNGQGSWSLAVPSYVHIRRHYSALTVRCEAPNKAPVEVKFAASSKSSSYGNALVGGLAGASVDVLGGAAFEYPQVLVVPMDEASAQPNEAAAARQLAALKLASRAMRDPRPGDVISYRVEDRYSGIARTESSTVTEVAGGEVVYDGGRRRQALPGARPIYRSRALWGDLELLEPPEGWAPPSSLPSVGQTWSLAYTAVDGQPPSRLDLKASVIRREVLQTPAGVFKAWVIDVEGTAQRPGPVGFTAYPTRMRVWVDVGSHVAVRLETDVKASGSNSSGQSREIVELASVALAPGLGAETRAAALENADAPDRDDDFGKTGQTLLQWRPGLRLTYDIIDRYTQATRRASTVVTALSPRELVFDAGRRVLQLPNAEPSQRRVALLGDLEQLEPPQGWLHYRLAVGQVWELRYQAMDDAPASSVVLKATVARRELLRTKAGTFDAWVIDYEGDAVRTGAYGAVTGHNAMLRLWVDRHSRVLLRLESKVLPVGGLSWGRPSNELVELVGLSQELPERGQP